MKLFRFTAVAALVCWLWGSHVFGQDAIRFVNQTELGIFSGEAHLFDRSVFALQTFNGARFNEFVELGATVGLDVYRDITLLPIAVGWRGVLPGEGVSPYLGLDVGYGLTWLKKDTDTEWYDGGLMFNPVFGIRMKSRGKDRFSLSLGYRRQTYSASEGQPLLGVTNRVPESGASLPPGLASHRKDVFTIQRMSIRFGMVF